MDELSVTAFGPVDSTLAHAARHTVASAAVPALIVLDDVHLRLGIAYTATGAVPPSQRPSDRWVQLMRYLFRFDHYDRPASDADPRPAWVPPARGVRGRVAAAPIAQRRALCRVMVQAATFLLAEGMVAEDAVELAAHVHRGRRRPFGLVPADAIAAIDVGVREATTSLLDRSEAQGGPLLLSPVSDRPFRRYCRATRWETRCDIIHPRTPECPPLQRTRKTSDDRPTTETLDA